MAYEPTQQHPTDPGTREQWKKLAELYESKLTSTEAENKALLEELADTRRELVRARRGAGLADANAESARVELWRTIGTYIYHCDGDPRKGSDPEQQRLIEEAALAFARAHDGA